MGYRYEHLGICILIKILSSYDPPRTDGSSYICMHLYLQFNTYIKYNIDVYCQGFSPLVGYQFCTRRELCVHLSFQLHARTIRYLHPNLPSRAYVYLSTCLFIFYVCTYIYIHIYSIFVFIDIDIEKCKQTI